MSDIIKNIPEILIWILPGFLSLRIIEKYSLFKRKDEFNSLMYSLLISFVCNVCSYVILRSFSISLLATSIKDFIIKTLLCFFFAFTISFVIIKINTGKASNIWCRIFNSKLTALPSVWIKAMQNPDGAYAIAHTKSGLIYCGALIDYSADANENDRDILLYGYKIYDEDGKINRNDKSHLYNGDNSIKVYLSKEQIEVVEIIIDK